VIKITVNKEKECKGCGSRHDVYDVSISRNDKDMDFVVALCPSCRKQLSNMLTKRVK
jgi:hypothetical protein